MNLEIILLGVFAVVIMTIAYSNELSAISLPAKDFTCTESAIVNGVAECVRYERREK